MLTTPTVIMEIMLGPPPIDLFMITEAQKAANMLQCSCLYRTTFLGYIRTTNMQMGTDNIDNRYLFSKPFRVKLIYGGSWRRIIRGICCGIKNSNTKESTGTEVYGLRPGLKHSINLGRYTSFSGREI